MAHAHAHACTHTHTHAHTHARSTVSSTLKGKVTESYPKLLTVAANFVGEVYEYSSMCTSHLLNRSSGRDDQ